MSRKDFEAIARIISNRKDWANSTIDFDRGYELALEHIEEDLADYFQEINPNFDRLRFLTACASA